METTKVECFSSHTYADRPIAITWEGERLPILDIVDSWREPVGKRFRVRLEDGRIFLLTYDEQHDNWIIEMV